jgi:hypothetical protein
MEHTPLEGQPSCLQSEPWPLIRLTVAEIRRLLWRLVWLIVPATTFILGWSQWRRHHQALAMACHYKTRLLATQLQL